jgi:hypothetical protein
MSLDAFKLLDIKVNRFERRFNLLIERLIGYAYGEEHSKNSVCGGKKKHGNRD